MACTNEKAQVFAELCMGGYLKGLPTNKKKPGANKLGPDAANKAHKTTMLNINTNRIF